MNICCIELTKSAQKDLSKVPSFIKDKLLLWIDAVERLGVYQVRKIPGFHDEPLKRKELHIISIIEVNKHEY